MLKKFIVILVLFILVIAGLQLFGDRDFGQMDDAWDKYRHGGDLGSLSEDVVIIFSGGKVNTGGLDVAKTVERLMYRWTDERGVIHNGEHPPKTGEYEVIRLGELNVKTQKGMEKEEIDKALNGG